MPIRPIVHALLHIIAPAAAARFALQRRRWRGFLLMMATMAVDLDHLLADPVFDPHRCSLGFHPLHTWPAILVYVAMTFPPKTRIVGWGLVIHMILDGIDCLWMRYG